MTPKTCGLAGCHNMAFGDGLLCVKHEITLMFRIRKDPEGTVMPCGHPATSIRGGKTTWYCEDCKIINERLEWVTRGER